MAGIAEANRRRAALALVLVGFGLILLGVALVIQHRNLIRASQASYQEQIAERNIPLASAIQQVLFWLLVLVGVFSLSLFAFLRWSRHYRRWLLRRPPPPSPHDDAWAMHRLPDPTLSDEQAEPGGPGPEAGG